MKRRWAGASVLAVVAATASAQWATPTPVPPRKPVVVYDLPEPTPSAAPTPSLSDLARRVKARPPGERQGSVSGGAGPDLYVGSLHISPVGGGTSVRGALRNTGKRPLWVIVIAECRDASGDPDAYLLETAVDGPLDGGDWEEFGGELPGVEPRTVRVRAIVAGMGGRIETAEERRLTACLSFGAVAPLPATMASPSLEVRIANGCDKAVPASRTWFFLVVRDAVGNVVGRKADRLSEPIPPNGMGRRQVTIRVPSGAKIEIAHYDPYG